MIWGFLIAPVCLFFLIWSVYAISGMSAEKFLGKDTSKLDSVLSILFFAVGLTGFIISILLISKG